MSIRTRLLLIALMACLLAASVVVWRFVRERQAEIATATQRLPALASRVAAGIAERIHGTEQLQFGLARADELETRDRGRCSTFLAEVLRKYPQYTGIITIDPNGKLFCDSLGTERDLDLTDRDYFKRAVAGNEIVTQPVFGRLTGLAVLQIAYPVRAESGELKFVLLASLDLVRRLAGTRYQDSSIPAVRILLVDDEGLVLATSGAPGAKAKPGTSIAQSAAFKFAKAHSRGEVTELPKADGTTEVWAVADAPLVRAAGIHVLVCHSKEELGAAANRKLAEAMLILALAAAVAFLGVWFFGEMAIRRPVETIAGMVQRLGRNELDARIPKPHARGELGVLMELLNESAQSQQRQQAAIAELNDKLRQAQRLESVGQLTGGVAHDFNNLLTVILGNAELLHEMLAGHPKLSPMAGMIVDAAERGADLTQRLLAFARRQALEPQAVDVNARVAGLDAMLRRTLGEHIQIGFRHDTAPWLALVDPAQLDNALLNLCLNARDAMPHGGRLTIETARVRLDLAYVQAHPDVRPGDYVMLAVSDTGTGIAPEHLERVFEPFFTTKAKGKGTGLGLAMIYGFVKQSGGHVAIYSEPGDGTTVKLYLPRAEGAAQAPSERTPAEPVGGSETLLLVEDDASVRRYAHQQLVALGYRVIEAHDGAQALEFLRGGAAVDLLFTDVVMPGMSGRELAEQATQLRPGLKVLYTSGYAEDAIVHQGRLDAGVHLLSKPYRREEMARRIREALEDLPRAEENSFFSPL